MKIRLLVQDTPDGGGCFHGLKYHSYGVDVSRPVKLQVSHPNLWGNYTEWEDVEIVFESEVKKDEN